ncbi:hypothetical protein [Buttiauxella brennerae]|uniref:hypothetical protein n=1 Tax=Buttiauxella brennerae TaxID=82988 RepID=UPI00286F9E80|nr:hypothetical protein [Buttiauxella brennerae]
MGLFGGDSTTNSTSNTTSWLASSLEPIINDFISSNPSLDYTNSQVAGLTPAQQAALGVFGGGASIGTGTSIAGKGAGLVSDSISGMQNLLHGGAVDQMKKGVSGIYGAASGFIDGQNKAIQDSVYSEMAGDFGNVAQSTMASTSVAGSSAAGNAQASVLASGANKMTQMKADVSSSVLKTAVGLTGGAISAEAGLMKTLGGAGGQIFGAGTSMASKGLNNQFKAGLFEQYFNQQVLNNNHKNDMINNNMDWINMSMLLSTLLPAAGLDTTTTGSSSTEKSGGGIGKLLTAGATGLAGGFGASLMTGALK